MRSADRAILVLMIWLTAGLGGCATSLPSTNPRLPTPPPAAERPSGSAADPEAQRQFAHALSAIKLGRYQDAERELLALTHSHPQLSGPFANLGIVYYRLGKMTEATEALTTAIGINSGHAAYYNQLGIVYRQRGQLDKARDAYLKALDADPGHPNTHLNLGILYDLYLQDVSKALQHYERYQSLLPAADASVTKWIIDLKQRGQRGSQTARGNNG
jgi:tetratricopeptide (TPR) repeat protein